MSVTCVFATSIRTIVLLLSHATRIIFSLHKLLKLVSSRTVYVQTHLVIIIYCHHYVGGHSERQKIHKNASLIYTENLNCVVSFDPTSPAYYFRRIAFFSTHRFFSKLSIYNASRSHRATTMSRKLVHN